MIKLKNVSYFYGREPHQIRALDNITLQISDGEFVVVLGRNGSGKSTLAQQLNGTLIPTEGTVVVDGLSTSEPESLWDIRCLVGMVFQNPDNQIIATTVEDDVAFGPENLGLKREEIRRRVDDALEAVDMLDYLKFEPHFLSGGEKQRVAVAGALAVAPRHLVMDEPTSMLDPASRRHILETAHRLCRERKMTVVHATHFPDEAVFGDRVLVLSQGRVAFDGSPRRLFDDIDRLDSLGLAAPPIRRLSEALIKGGIPLAPPPLCVEELVRSLID